MNCVPAAAVKNTKNAADNNRGHFFSYFINGRISPDSLVAVSLGMFGAVAIGH